MAALKRANNGGPEKGHKRRSTMAALKRANIVHFKHISFNDKMSGESSRLGLEAAETPWKTRWQDLVAEELAAVHEVGPVEASDGPWVTLGQVLGGKPRLQTSVADLGGRGRQNRTLGS